MRAFPLVAFFFSERGEIPWNRFSVPYTDVFLLEFHANRPPAGLLAGLGVQ